MDPRFDAKSIVGSWKQASYHQFTLELILRVCLLLSGFFLCVCRLDDAMLCSLIAHTRIGLTCFQNLQSDNQNELFYFFLNSSQYLLHEQKVLDMTPCNSKSYSKVLSIIFLLMLYPNHLFLLAMNTSRTELPQWENCPDWFQK